MAQKQWKGLRVLLSLLFAAIYGSAVFADTCPPISSFSEYGLPGICILKITLSSF